MADPKHLYLPEMTGGITEPQVAGVWHGYPRGLLRSLSDGIVVGPGADVRGVSSVPDAWARPLMFQNALRPHSGHPMRARVVQEWRGLLSLLALHGYHGYPVKFVPVSLGDAGAVRGPAREFVRALTRLLPAPVALERDTPYAWTDTLLVCYGEERIPVGAFSPTTLVYTAADYARRFRDVTINLKDAHGFLAPPAAGQSEDLLYVAEWVKQLRRRLNAPRGAGAAILDSSSEAPTARDAIATINALLDEWIAELDGALRDDRGRPLATTDVEVDPEVAEVQPAPAFLDRYHVYRELLRPLRRSADGAGAVASDLLLRHTRNRSAHDHVVVITPALLRTGGKIWGASRLAQLGGDAGRAVDQHFDARDGWGERFDREDLKPANAIWIRPERYFLAGTMAATPDGGALLAPDWQALNGEQSYLLPFTARVLDFFTPTEVREVLRPEFKKVERGVEFSFSLPLDGRSERVKKVYRDANPAPGEGVVVRLAVPPVQLFPRYVDARWRRYYVLQGDADRVAVHPVVPATCRVAERTHTPVEGGGVARAVEIAGDDAFPEALVFRPAGRADAAYGLALVPRPPEPAGLAGTWRVGIDFGTSNTNVFRLDASNLTAERWCFRFDRYVWNVTPAAGGPSGAGARAVFLPAAPVDLPVPTALRVFQDATKEHPLLDYFIYFPTSYELPDDVHADIKWDSEEKQQTKYFLESLLLLLLVEVGVRRVKSVTLACSYPKAFSDERLTLYKGEWEEVVRRLLDDEDCVVRRLAPGDPEQPHVLKVSDPVFEAEGKASGEFFASERTNGGDTGRERLRIAGVCLDVGGGTTDISIWHNKRIAYDASVLLAGRQISAFLQKNQRVLEAVLSPAAAAALAPKRDRPADFAARLNVILKREEGAVRQRLIDNANSREVQRFRRILAVEFGAIAFYTASLIGAVDRKLARQRSGAGANSAGANSAGANGAGPGPLGAELAAGGVSLYWGGNAAKLINWIDLGRYDPAGIASKMLNALLFQGLADLKITVPASDLAQKQSPFHKSEAAGGLVVMATGADRPRARAELDDDYAMEPASDDPLADGVVCGEDIELTDGRRVGHLDVLTEADLFGDGETRFGGTSLDRLTRFVEVVNFFGVRRGLFTEATKVELDPKRRRAIADAVRARFIDAQDLPPGQREVEPVFIMQVTKLLELLQAESHAEPR